MIFSQRIFSSEERGCVNAPLSLRNIACIQIAFEKDHFLDNPQIIAWANRYEKYLVLGIGGSSLCGQAIQQACCKNKRVCFVDNIYPQSFYNILQELDLQRTGILVISKSGETIETLAQISLVLERYSCDDIAAHVLVITEHKPSSLMKIQNQFNTLYVEHPKDIGGRYSIFSPVGMLPAYLMGCDTSKIKRGGTDLLNSNTYTCGANFMKRAYEHSQRNSVFMTYSDKLSKFKEWIAQLYAESSGKDGEGITPLLATGTVDQHSQLQLYLGGTKDKNFSIFIEKIQNEMPFGNSDFIYNILRGKSLGELFMSEAYATAETIQQHTLPIRIFEFDQITEYEIGALFMHFMLEVILFCNAISVNPFDQPHVEFGKKLAIDKLCRKQ